MLSWSFAFLIIAVLAALLSFAGIGDTAAGVTKIFFLVFLVGFALSLIYGRKRVRKSGRYP